MIRNLYQSSWPVREETQIWCLGAKDLMSGPPKWTEVPDRLRCLLSLAGRTVSDQSSRLVPAHPALDALCPVRVPRRFSQHWLFGVKEGRGPGPRGIQLESSVGPALLGGDWPLRQPPQASRGAPSSAVRVAGPVPEAERRNSCRRSGARAAASRAQSPRRAPGSSAGRSRRRGARPPAALAQPGPRAPARRAGGSCSQQLGGGGARRPRCGRGQSQASGPPLPSRAPTPARGGRERGGAPPAPPLVFQPPRRQGQHGSRRRAEPPAQPRRRAPARPARAPT